MMNTILERLLQRASNNRIYKGGGCLPQSTDKRDWLWKARTQILNATNLPLEYESQLDKKYIYNQELSNECVACAYCTLRLLQESEQSNLQEQFSPSFQYANRVQGQNYEGYDLRSVCKKGREGSVLWKDFPNFYTYQKAHQIFEKNKHELLNKAYPYRINSFYLAKTNNEIMTAIYLTKGVLIGVNITDTFKTTKDGIINYSKNDESLGGHAICLIGWKKINNQYYWIFVNSWGNSWGDNGKGYISFKDLKQCAITDAYVLVDDINEHTIEYNKRRTFCNALQSILNWFRHNLPFIK